MKKPNVKKVLSYDNCIAPVIKPKIASGVGRQTENSKENTLFQQQLPMAYAHKWSPFYALLSLVDHTGP